MGLKQALRKLKLHTIGRVDRVDFPELGLYDVPAKIDSGAYTSSIHCESLEAYYESGEHRIAFRLPGSNRLYSAAVYASRRVRNSFGQTAYRYTIKTPVVLFGKEYPVELALTDRSAMKYPVLLGRQLLRNRFIIDVTRINLSFREKSRGSNKKKKN
ncbi:MAG: RimK/LysX family protein [Chitinophagales bacterium]|nr:RimK/LysX family protein [Chitinophagales bacterium]MDW8393451.1 RimK/LysX family protein [Chitinophagales bacterium]